MTMEEKKNQKPLSYEELKQNFGELHMQYQKLVQEYQKAMEALRQREFDYTSFFLQMLFKVLDHPEMYKEDFVTWCSENIQGALTTFAESMNAQRQPEQEPEKEKSSEAE